jgi:hypothetical protein
MAKTSQEARKAEYAAIRKSPDSVIGFMIGCNQAIRQAGLSGAAVGISVTAIGRASWLFGLRHSFNGGGDCQTSEEFHPFRGPCFDVILQNFPLKLLDIEVFDN